MTSTDNPSRPTAADGLASGLRAWARGLYPCEAAVEVLIGSGLHTRIAGYPDVIDAWREPDGTSWACVDWPQLAAVAQEGPWSGGERRVLLAVAALAGQAVPFDVAGLDRAYVRLVLAGVAHCAGWHETGYQTPVTGELPLPADETGFVAFADLDLRGQQLPTFEDVRSTAYRLLGDAADWLRSDTRGPRPPVGAHIDASLTAIGRAKNALNDAANEAHR